MLTVISFISLDANFESGFKHYSALVFDYNFLNLKASGSQKEKEDEKEGVDPFIILVTSFINFKSLDSGQKWFILLRKAIPGENVKEYRNINRCSVF